MSNVLKTILNIISRKEVYGVIVTIAVSYFVFRTMTILLEETINNGKDSYERKKRTTITRLFKNIAKYVILVIDMLTILSIYGVNVKGMVAGLGITATIIGLALQDTLKDIINGINLILENYYIVGDIVDYNGFIGEVIEFGLKSTKIKSFNGEVLNVANRNLLEIKNISAKEQIVTINIPLPYEEKVSDMEKLINKKILPKVQEVENVSSSSVEYLGVNELAENCVNYLIRFKCKRDKHYQAKRDANRIILLELEKAQVSVPYPQVEVHNNEK